MTQEIEQQVAAAATMTAIEQQVAAATTTPGGLQDLAPLAAPQVPQVPQVPQGLPLECDGALVPPMGSAQLLCLVPSEAVLEKLELMSGPADTKAPDGVRVIRVLVGQIMYPAFANGQEMGRWEDCYGKTAPLGSYLLVSVFNEGTDLKAVTGRWFVRLVNGSLPQPIPQAVVSQPAPQPQVLSQAPIVAGPQMAYAAQPAAQQQAQQQVLMHQVPRPGSNEVCCYLTREACRRLVESIMGSGPAITIYEKADLVRRFDAAMRSP
jgi:hypothetical protein